MTIEKPQGSDAPALSYPRLKGGNPIIISCPMSEEQHALHKDLVARYERLHPIAVGEPATQEDLDTWYELPRSGKVDPREPLAIATDHRKLALDSRLLSVTATDFPGSKINALVNRVTDIWSRTISTHGTQLIFSDMGENPTPWGFSVYQEIIDKLVKRGIPREQIASIGDADTAAKKQGLFEKVRHGTIRVLLGSTQKMGTGPNVQERLVALHHLDAPRDPGEEKQRDGRILRPGNTNEEVEIYRYVTEGSRDVSKWEDLETQSRFINQIMTGALTVPQAKDIGGRKSIH